MEMNVCVSHSGCTKVASRNGYDSLPSFRALGFLLEKTEISVIKGCFRFAYSGHSGIMEERNSRSKTIPEYLVYYPDETTPAMKPLQ